MVYRLDPDIDSNFQRHSLISSLSASKVAALRAIREAREISRADIARAIGLTPPAVSKIVAELIESGLVQEIGRGRSSGGRRPVLLSLNPTSYYIVGVERTQEGIRGVVADLDARIIHRTSVDLFPSSNRSAFEDLSEIISQLVATSPVGEGRILGVGCAVPDALSIGEGAGSRPPSLDGWGSLSLWAAVARELGVPVYLDNDTNACALAEKWFGCGKPYERIVYIAVGERVGASLIVHGVLDRGANDVAGALGHTTINMNGPRCDCGNYGCLDLYASGAAVVERMRHALEEGRQSAIRALVGEDLAAITLSMVIQAGLQGDRVARQVLYETGRFLGIGVVNAINLFDPEAVIIGRELALAGDLLLGPIREVVAERALPAAERVDIRLAELGEDASLVGAVVLVLSQLFSAQ